MSMPLLPSPADTIQIHGTNPLRRTVHCGFSLLEILIAVAVIGIIAAMLIPSLANARKSAGGAKCVANLRQIGQAFRGYIDDNNGYAPPHWGNSFFDPTGSLGLGTYLWTGHLAQYLDPSPNAHTKTLSPIFDCPVDQDLKKRPAMRGYQSTAANWTISYGYNYAFITSQNNWWRHAVEGYPNLRAMRNLTTLVLAADSLPTSAGGTDMALIDSTQPGNIKVGPDFRHQNRFNAVFVDGHVQGLDKSSLTNSAYWQLER